MKPLSLFKCLYSCNGWYITSGNEAGISVAFKNCAPFIKRTTHINNVFLDTAKKTSTAFKYKSNITGVTEVDGADGKVTNTNITVTKKFE